MTDDSSGVAESFDHLDAEDVPDSVDRAALDRMQTVAKLLDEAVTVPGTRFKVGLDPLLGSVPVVGDAVSAAVSLYIVGESARLGVSYGTLLKMLANVGIDSVGGAIPYVGVVFDAFWKANKWNLELLFEELEDGPGIDQERAVEIEVE